MTEIKKNTPKLRFPEFSEKWEKKKLGDVATFSKGKSISKSDISENGNIECIRYGELYTRYQEVIRLVQSRTNLNKEELVISEENDVIIPASGESRSDIATASCVLSSGIALGGDLNIIRSRNNGIYLSYYLNNKKKNDIANIAQGVSVVHLYSSQLKVLKILFPSLLEQQRIANFLTCVDKGIEKLQEKKSLLQSYKKGMMQKIFTQKIRFKDENGNNYPDWENKYLKDISSKIINKNKDNSINNVFTNSASRGIVNQRDYFDKDIANQNNLTNYYVVEKGDFIYNPRISNHAPVGPISLNHIGLGIMSPLYSVFRIKSGHLRFFEIYFSTTKWHEYMSSIANYGARSDRMNITSGDFYLMPLPFPSLLEQKKIANFLTSIDNKIEKIQTQIEQSQAFKKGLLQQMFV